MDRHKHVETSDDNELDTEWGENVNIGKQYAKTVKKILDKLTELQYM